MEKKQVTIVKLILTTLLVTANCSNDRLTPVRSQNCNIPPTNIVPSDTNFLSAPLSGNIRSITTQTVRKCSVGARATWSFVPANKESFDGLENVTVTQVKKDDLVTSDYSLKIDVSDTIETSNSSFNRDIDKPINLTYTSSGVNFAQNNMTGVPEKATKILSFKDRLYVLTELNRVFVADPQDLTGRPNEFLKSASLIAPDSVKEISGVRNIFKVLGTVNDLLALHSTEGKLYFFEVANPSQSVGKFMFAYNFTTFTLNESSLGKVLYDARASTMLMVLNEKVIKVYPRDLPDSTKENDPTNLRIDSQASIGDDTSYRVLDADIVNERGYLVIKNMGLYEVNLSSFGTSLVYKHSNLTGIAIGVNKFTNTTVLNVLVENSANICPEFLIVLFLIDGRVTFGKAYYSNSTHNFISVEASADLVYLVERRYDRVFFLRNGMPSGVAEHIYMLKSRYNVSSASQGPIVVGEGTRASLVFREGTEIYVLNNFTHGAEKFEGVFKEQGTYEISYTAYAENCNNKVEDREICVYKHRLIVEVGDPATGSRDCSNAPLEITSVVEDDYSSIAALSIGLLLAALFI